MRISLAQIHPEKGEIDRNIETHRRWIETAVEEKADLVAFSELSLTGYEPELADAMGLPANDERLTVFQELSDRHSIAIALGLPLRTEAGLFISMAIFSPHQPVQTYTKQQLHADEKPFFKEGNEQILIEVGGQHVAPAICYESLQESHAAHAHHLGASIYLASVAKNEAGIEKALKQYPKTAINYGMPVVMANCIGFCDNFLSVGQSAVWDEKGALVGQLKEDAEGLLTFDTETGEVTVR